MSSEINNNSGAEEEVQLQSPRERRGRRSGAPSGADVTTREPMVPDTSPSTEISSDEVSAEAYRIFLERGGEHGRHDEDWYEAERRCAERRRSS
jgi:hypothetical protein